MNWKSIAAIVFAVGLWVCPAGAQEVPGPQKEHAWLQQFVGDWDMETEIFLDPGQPPQKGQGTETVRTVGPFWTVAEGKGSFLGVPAAGFRTLGYDPQKKKYVSTWVHSQDSHLWTYEGTLDPTGKILTLEALGPKPGMPGELAKYRDVIEFKSPDYRVLTTSVLGEDGRWIHFVTVHSRRKK